MMPGMPRPSDRHGYIQPVSCRNRCCKLFPTVRSRGPTGAGCSTAGSDQFDKIGPSGNTPAHHAGNLSRPVGNAAQEMGMAAGHG